MDTKELLKKHRAKWPQTLVFFGREESGESTDVFGIAEPFLVWILDFELDHERAFLERISVNGHSFPVRNFKS